MQQACDPSTSGRGLGLTSYARVPPSCRRKHRWPLPDAFWGALGRNATKRGHQLDTDVAIRAGTSPASDHASSIAPPCTISATGARLAVFVSGGGSNFRAIHAACLDGRINGDVVAVVSDVPSCGGVQYAQQHGISTLTYPQSKKSPCPSALSTGQLVAALRGEHRVDFVILAGYLKLVPPELVKVFPRGMLNIHPGLLPAFGGKGYYGQRVHEAVIRAGARFSGPSVHFVDEEYDTGPILAQRVVPVYPTDTPQRLAARVLAEEHKVYPDAVSALCDGRITWREDGIPIIWDAR